MNTFIEYQLEDGSTIQVLAPAGVEGDMPVKLSALGESRVIQAEKTFSEAMEGALKSAAALLQKFKALRADEVELTFGLLATGELGNFAVGKVGVEAGYEVTLKWKNKKEAAPPEKS